MTKEELEKEAIKYAVDYPTSYGKGYKHKDLRIAYLASAEPREKRIAELEDINKELFHALSNHDRDVLLTNKKIAELEKENAELKEKADKCLHLADVRLEQELETYQKLHIKSREKLDAEIALDEAKDQLTKAKELLKQWLQTSKASGCDNINIVTDTEQFLNSGVEK